MSRDLSTARVGDRLELVVRGTGIHRETFELAKVETIRTATVHYVRRRGDLQVDIEGGATRIWVDSDGWVRDCPDHVVAFVRWPREATNA